VLTLIDEKYTGSNMVFVGGCPRSGTTWFQTLLSCHPGIRTVREAHIFDHFFMPIQWAWQKSVSGGSLGSGPAGYLTEEEFSVASRSFLMSLVRPLVAPLKHGELFLEKTPANALFFRQIVESFPDCRIIHVLRDPRDVVASLIAASGSWGSRWAPRSARRAVRMWRQYVRAVKEARSSLPPRQFLEVRYEDLLSDPAKVLRECASFLGLEWSDAQLAQAISANEPQRALAAKGGTPLPSGGELGRRFSAAAQYPDGFVRNAKSGGWKRDLTIADKLWVWCRARKDMAANGYSW